MGDDDPTGSDLFFTVSCDPAIFPIKIRRQITYGPLVITTKDSNDDVVPLTGFSVFAIARPELESPNNIDLLPVITNAAGGVITIELTDVQTGKFPLGNYVWDLVLENASGERIGPFLAGPLSVLDVVSRE